MTTLTPGKVFRSREPTLTVENDLAPGKHLFQLTVVDDGGLESEPAELVVAVLDRRTTSPPTTSPPVSPPGRVPIDRTDPRILAPVRPAPPPPPPDIRISPVIRPVRPIR